jgi:hypothetical protein
MSGIRHMVACFGPGFHAPKSETADCYMSVFACKACHQNIPCARGDNAWFLD